APAPIGGRSIHLIPALPSRGRGGGNTMKKFAAVLLGTTVLFAGVGAAYAQDLTVGVSWASFQEERWKTDEAAMIAALEAAGARYISADAQSSAAKQLTDIESLIAQGADALI